MVNWKCIAGGMLSYGYNDIIGKVPSRKLRLLYLSSYLGALGKETSVQMRCRFLNARKVYLGNNNVINFGCIFDGRHYQIKTGSNVSIGPEATILTLGHDPQSADFKDLGGDVLIEDYAWIGYRAIILPGITIGEGAVVGAGSIVTRNVSPYTIVAGNPAKFIKSRTKTLKYQLSYNPWLL